jgi:hypothetical protein
MRTHPVNVTHLVFGLAFLGIAGCWALTEAGVIDGRAGWILPLVLVVAGAAGLVASMAKGLHRTAAERPLPYDEADARPEDWRDEETDDGPVTEPTQVLGGGPDEEPTQVLGDR